MSGSATRTRQQRRIQSQALNNLSSVSNEVGLTSEDGIHVTLAWGRGIRDERKCPLYLRQCSRRKDGIGSPVEKRIGLIRVAKRKPLREDIFSLFLSVSRIGRIPLCEGGSAEMWIRPRHQENRRDHFSGVNHYCMHQYMYQNSLVERTDRRRGKSSLVRAEYTSQGQLKSHRQLVRK